MRNFRNGFRQAGGFIAGLLIGLSVIIPVSAMVQTDSGDGQIVWMFGALIVLGLGLELRAVSTLRPRY
jgi:hypothetical protein